METPGESSLREAFFQNLVHTRTVHGLNVILWWNSESILNQPTVNSWITMQWLERSARVPPHSGMGNVRKTFATSHNKAISTIGTSSNRLRQSEFIISQSKCKQQLVADKQSNWKRHYISSNSNRTHNHSLRSSVFAIIAQTQSPFAHYPNTPHTTKEENEK